MKIVVRHLNAIAEFDILIVCIGIRNFDELPFGLVFFPYEGLTPNLLEYKPDNL